MFPVRLMLVFPPNCTGAAEASYMAMYWNNAALDCRAEGSDEALGAIDGPVMVIVAFPWLLIVAPGSRMKVAVPEITGVPVIFRVPEMKYTPDRVTGVLDVMWRPSFVHGFAAV